MKSIPRRNSRCSHFEWFAWCICTLLFTKRKMYCMQQQQQQQQKHALRTITQRDSLWISLGKNAPESKRDRAEKNGEAKRAEKKESKWHSTAKLNWKPNETMCRLCRKFPILFSVTIENFAIEIKELIPINFIAPVRLFSRYTMAKWGTEWTDSDLYMCIRRDTSCSGSTFIALEESSLIFFCLIRSSTECSFETQTVMNIKSFLETKSEWF